MKKASEIFEGENSSLKKTFGEAVGERSVEQRDTKSVNSISSNKEANSNAERSVEECTQEIISQMTGDDLSKDRMSWLIKTALQAERQKREEMVEAIRAKKSFRVQETNERNTKYFTRLSQHRDTIDDIIQALTHPNNPK